MKVLILNDFLQNASSIKDRLLNYTDGIESVVICYSQQEAIQQIDRYGIHMIILNMEAKGASEFLLLANKHPHRIISTSTNYSRDYFTARLLESEVSAVSNATTEHSRIKNAFNRLLHQLFF